MLRRVLLGAARSGRAKDLATRLPVASGVVARFVAGEGLDDAVRVARELQSDGLSVSLDHLGEGTHDRDRAAEVADAYVTLLRRIADEGLSDSTEVSLKLSSVGQALPDGQPLALEHARRVCAAAKEAGTTVTFDMEDHTTTDSTLEVLRGVREDFPSTGAVLQAYLRRTEADCRDLASAGSRVRLCKGAYDEPESVAYQDRHKVDLSYVRCLRVLMAGEGYPMVATHDPRLVAIAQSLALQHRRSQDRYELQMLYGVRPAEQRRLAEVGETVRVYTPYGSDWYHYLVRRLAERPANVTFFLRSLATKG